MIVSSTFLLESGKPKRTLSNPEQLQQAGWIDENIANMIAGVSTRKLSTTVENLELQDRKPGR